MKSKFLIFTLALILTSCYRDVDQIKKSAPDFLKQRGYEIVSYDGYEFDGAFCGGLVAYQVKDKDGYLYTLEIMEWDNEYHIYNQKCLNAVSNR